MGVHTTTYLFIYLIRLRKIFPLERRLHIANDEFNVESCNPDLKDE
jgi:hypothetical protein